MNTTFLRAFPFLILFSIYSCESNKTFSFYKESNEKEVQSEKKAEEKGRLIPKTPGNLVKKNSDNTKDAKLSELSEMGQARKDKSEIISFFLDLFEDDENENEKEKLSKAPKEEKTKKLEEAFTGNKQKETVKKIILQRESQAKEKVRKAESLEEKKKETREISNDLLGQSDKSELDVVKEEIEIKEISEDKNEVADVIKNEGSKEVLTFFRQKEIKIEEKPLPSQELIYEDIGMLIPLTGKKKAAGDLVMNSLRYSMSTKPSKLVFKIYDTKGTPSGAIEAAKQGINDGIKIFIGPIFSDETKEIKDYLSSGEAIFFSLSPDFSNISKNIIVSGENPDDQISCIKKNLTENELERVLLIFQNNKYGQVIKESFNNTRNNNFKRFNVDFFELSDFVNLNDEIKILSRFESRKLRLNEEINRVKSNKTLTSTERKFQLKNLEKQLTLDVPYDAVIVASQGDKLIEVLSHLAFYDINSDNTFIYGTSLWEDTKKSDKVFEGTFYVTSLKEKPENFRQDFIDIFSKDPLSFNYYIYDLIDLVSNYKPKNEENQNIHFGTFSNSQIDLGLLRRETFLKKVLKNERVLNISSCSLSEL